MDKNERAMLRSAITEHRFKAARYRIVYNETGMRTAEAMAVISENAADELERLVKEEECNEE